jgi:hypothetical protein
MVVLDLAGIQLLYRPPFQAEWVPDQEWSRSTMRCALVVEVSRCHGCSTLPPLGPLVVWWNTSEPLGKRSSEVSPNPRTPESLP